MVAMGESGAVAGRVTSDSMVAAATRRSITRGWSVGTGQL
jgi:hypothetical protein